MVEATSADVRAHHPRVVPAGNRPLLRLLALAESRVLEAGAQGGRAADSRCAARAACSGCSRTAGSPRSCRPAPPARWRCSAAATSSGCSGRSDRAHGRNPAEHAAVGETRRPDWRRCTRPVSARVLDVRIRVAVVVGRTGRSRPARSSAVGTRNRMTSLPPVRGSNSWV